jgi:hypothetical protein
MQNNIKNVLFDFFTLISPLENPLENPSQQESASVQVIDINYGAGDRARTGDVQLGKLTFYH